MTDDTDVPLVSVVIPVLHDSAALARLLPRLMEQLRGRPAEVVVVSGAPLDDPMQRLAETYEGASWVVGRPGRATQMNTGARQARGQWVLFLHADTQLDDGWFDALARADAAGEQAVCFRFALVSRAVVARVIEWGVRGRVGLLGLPYGDQALGVRRVVFDEQGGFAPLPLMEDVEIVRRFRRRGILFRPLPVAARTSARRWERDGWIRRSGTNMLLVALYYLRVSPHRLAAWYHRGQPGGGPAQPVLEHPMGPADA